MMKDLLLDPEYSINTGSSYFIEEPSLREDWLIFILFYDVIYTLTGANQKKLQESIIEIRQYPLDKIFTEYNFTDKFPSDPEENELRLIQLCIDEGIQYLPNPVSTDREEVISRIGSIISESISFLKESFLRFDIFSRVVLPHLPRINGTISIELVEQIKEFKDSDYRQSISEGIDLLVQRYKGNYQLNAQLESEIHDWLIEYQSEFLKLLDFEKFKSFDFKVLFEDGVATVGGLLTPFLPLGTIKEIYTYIKNLRKLKSSKELLFVFSLMYLQKTLNKLFKKGDTLNQCPVCKITKVEIEQLPDDEIHQFVFSSAENLCQGHLIGYLTVRKFGMLSGKKLLLALKEVEKS